MQITREQLMNAVPALKTNSGYVRTDEFVASFNMWAIPYGIDTPKRMVHYLAQVMHESGALRYSEEIASGKQYEGRKDLGNTEPGDGVLFKGRGYIQLTGRGNYQAYKDSDLCLVDVIEHPERVAQFPHNQMSSMWFWQRNKLNETADQDDGKNSEEIVKRITKRVNGGYSHLDDRIKYYWALRKQIGLCLVCMICVLLGSCKSVEYVSVPEYHTVTVAKTDSFIQKDSVFCHDSVYIRQKGDTVWLEKWHTKYIDKVREVIRTDSLVKRDSIAVPYPVERKLSKWEQTKIDWGGKAIIAVVLVFFIIIWLIVKRLQR